MIPWQVRAAAAFAHGAVGQCVRARGRRAGVLPLLTARDPAEDPSPDLITARGVPGARLAVVV
ncbi:MAG: hypothetical protein GX427_08215, partial [Actinomycetales bacterium]|nr:hypothetical protein [Actinomycetales bacterium]